MTNPDQGSKLAALFGSVGTATVSNDVLRAIPDRARKACRIVPSRKAQHLDYCCTAAKRWELLLRIDSTIPSTWRTIREKVKSGGGFVTLWFPWVLWESSLCGWDGTLRIEP